LSRLMSFTPWAVRLSSFEPMVSILWRMTMPFW
jgi:hypothetical protein